MSFYDPPKYQNPRQVELILDLYCETNLSRKEIAREAWTTHARVCAIIRKAYSGFGPRRVYLAWERRNKLGLER